MINLQGLTTERGAIQSLYTKKSLHQTTVVSPAPARSHTKRVLESWSVPQWFQLLTVPPAEIRECPETFMAGGQTVQKKIKTWGNINVDHVYTNCWHICRAIFVMIEAKHMYAILESKTSTQHSFPIDHFPMNLNSMHWSWYSNYYKYVNDMIQNVPLPSSKHPKIISLTDRDTGQKKSLLDLVLRKQNIRMKSVHLSSTKPTHDE